MAMGTVHNLNPARDLEEFCDFLYGKDTGFVYMPVKNEETGDWSDAFHFEWPKQKKAIVDHVERYSSAHNVYIAPALFSERSNQIDYVKGTNVAWAEFDGNLPTAQQMQEANVPEPTLRIRSSVPGREHWYWHYDEFQTDLKHIQDVNKGLAYALGADTSGWDACQVLRPVGSINHKREAKHSVTIIKHKHVSYGIQSFAKIPVPEDSYTLEDFNKSKIPNPAKLLVKYDGWSSDEVDLLFRAVIKEGARSSALARVAYTCCEKGMNNNEVYSVIQWVDERWKKFYDRPNKEKYYISLINVARVKVPYEGIKGVAAGSILPILSFNQVLTAQDNIDWIIEGLLPGKGLLFFVGKSGHGKTIMTTGLGMCLATGKKYLRWEAVDNKPRKTLLLSLEMNVAELKENFTKQAGYFDEDELKLLEENFFIYAAQEGVEYVPIKFYNTEQLGRLMATIESINPDIVIVDSATKAISKDMNVQAEVSQSMEAIYRMRNKLNFSMIIIHHTRKNPPAHGHKEADIDDMFGAQALQQDASAIISIAQSKDYTEGNKLTDIRYLKTRFKGDSSHFTAVMNQNLMFSMPTFGELVASAPTIPKQQDKPKEKKDSGTSFFGGSF